MKRGARISRGARQLYLTNAERADVIDALDLAVDWIDSDLRSNFPPFRKDWSKHERDHFEELGAQRKRYRKLRRAYLAEEKRA
jgi:hypothetical protein